MAVIPLSNLYCPLTFSNLLSVSHAWTTESKLCWVWLGAWYQKWGCLGLICETILQDVRWIRNTYNYFTKTTLLWHGQSFNPPSPSSNKIIYITVMFNCFSNVCMYILIITRSVNNPPLWRHSDVTLKALCQVFLVEVFPWSIEGRCTPVVTLTDLLIHRK